MPPDKRRSRRVRWLAVSAIGLIAGVAVVATASGFDPDSRLGRAHVTFLEPLHPVPGAATIKVSDIAVGRPIQPGFVGLSLEYTAIEPYAGTDPSAIDPVLVQLIRGLAPGQRPVLRLGGDSTDWVWWPVPGLRKPAGIRSALGPRFGAVLGALARAAGARLILGIDLEADSRTIAGFEARRLIQSTGRDAVAALELGNEPELYGSWPWRAPPGGPRIMGRAAGYGPAAYIRDVRQIARGLPAVGLAGPALGGPSWISRVGQFIAHEPRLALVTVHTYPLQECYTPLVSPTFPTIGHLLASAASRGLAARLAPTVRTVHGAGLPLRVDEINSVSCSGARGVSDTFASALWALDTMFAMAQVGVDGVNVHTLPAASYRLFRLERSHGRWRGSVAPEYYGLLLFARATPPGSRLLRTSGGSTGALRAWATRGADGTLRVVLINVSGGGRTVVVRAPDSGRPAAYQALRAPGIAARGDISLGGVSFGVHTETGVLGQPRQILVRPEDGAYVLRLAGASAVMLTIT